MTASHTGNLLPLAELLQKEKPPSPGGLVGRLVPLSRAGDPAVLAVDVDGQLHFLLSPSASDPARLERFGRRTLQVGNRQWAVHGRVVSDYLDLSCPVPLGSPLRRPFLALCEDILLELQRPGTVEDAVRRTLLRWHRFWDEEGEDGFSERWLIGLFGELAFLLDLLTREGLGAVAAWTGPEALDHDFQSAAAVAFEVKTTTRMPPVIECNLQQLDPGLFDVLFLVCALVKRGEDGTTLPALVSAVEERLQSDEEILETFASKLARAGYRRQLSDEYSVRRLRLEAIRYFRVGFGFPRLTHTSFREPPDSRIQEIRYRLELSDIPSVAEMDPELIASRRRLCQPPAC
jgi:hypothetical protein